MPFDLDNFALGDMLRCGTGLRQAAQGKATMEDAAGAIVRYFRDECRDPATGEQSCPLVRLYKTHPYETLDPPLKAFAARLLGDTPPRPGMKCLTLLATAGAETEWNSRRASRRHRAIPLPSAQVVEQAPMIAQLIKQLGLDIAHVVDPAPELVRELEGRTYNVFHVEDAAGSAYIPAQDDFVVPYGIRSVLGFGGLLRSGELFAVILFSRAHIDRESAGRFRNIALDVKSVLFRYGDDQVFAARAGAAAKDAQPLPRDS
ncbi:MAG TPA: hypothetical protein VNA89_07015 [Gemmatimonadaceae bacterium]|nr:hypothetical protein [Gemmatimonadaceae bacterium]